MLAAAGLGCGLGPLSLQSAPSVPLRTGAPFTVDVWETEEGLPGNEVIAMTRTRDGYLWLGTLNGLVRFDGHRFTVFDESNTPGLPSSQIVSLFEDSRSNLWVGTVTAGVALIQHGRVRNLDIGRGNHGGRLRSVCEDASGAVWLYTADGELARYRDGEVNVWRTDPDPERTSTCRAVIAEKDGPVWVGRDGTQFAINPMTNEIPRQLPILREMPVTKLDYLLASQEGGYWRLADGRIQKWKNNRLEHDWGSYPWGRGTVQVSTACEDRQGNLLVGTLGAGLFWFDAQGKVTSLSTNEGLSYNYILSLHVDREGSLWVGTDGGGLNRVKRQVFDVLEATRGLVVQSVSEDQDGGLWIGSNGGGVGYWKDGELERFGYGQGLLTLYVRAVLADRNRRVWAGTLGGGLLELRDGQFQRGEWSAQINPVVLAIHQDRQGRLWLGTRGGLVRGDEQEWKLFTTREGLSTNVVGAIADDPEGNLWVGTVGGGLNLWRDGRFTSFHKQDGLPAETITSLYVDAEGVLWIGTSLGLARLDHGQWTRYTTREGLISNSIGYLLDDGLGFLWMGSNAGLMRIPKQALNDVAQGLAATLLGRAYGKSDGLPASECTLGSQPGACRTRNGTLWFPTIKGLVSLNPAQLKPNPIPPPVMIESILIDGQDQYPNHLRTGPPSTVVIPAGKERLEIQYTSLNLSAPGRARFQYRLEGLETAWTDAGNERVAHYTKLPPGHYRFQVKACNEDGVWNEIGSSVAFFVQPPFWQTWWFLGATTVFALGAIVAVVHYLSTQKLHRQLEQLRQQEALERERARIARDIHDQLGASLTQVSLLGELVENDKDSPAEVEAHARQISQTARDTTRALDEIVWTVNPSNDTLDGLITYVCKYAQDYLGVAGLRYRLEVPAQLPEAPISPEVRHNLFLASKEAVTNVVRHAGATSVRIRLRLDRGRFSLEIEDNGRGLAGLDETAARSRNGLRNMRKRMEDIGGGFAIEPAPEGGTVVRLSAPLASEKIDGKGLAV
jgi:ligand-binding sensor domain-containing protein/signal transduction histidine kinase